MDKESVRIGFYGDDFSGTTATAETLTQSGVATVIFTNPPSPSYLKRHFSRISAVGIMGAARTLPADVIKQELAPVFDVMKSYRAPIYLYKICSTFDSSARVGNIGKAIELGLEIFSPEFVPVLAAAPKLGRHTVFGNHFAAVGDGEIFRLDRHPSMSKHPVTPMQEADLCRHLAKQTELRKGLINILDINAGPAMIDSQIDKLVSAGVPIIFFDCITDNDLNTICETIFGRISKIKPLFFVGSQELGYGLAAACNEAGLLPARDKMRLPDKAGKDRGPLLVLSGSCATVTGEQIRWARKNGFVDVSIQPQDLLDYDKKNSVKQKIVGQALKALADGHSVILHTAIGPDDSRIKAMAQATEKLSLSDTEANEILGNALGELAREIVGNSRVKRLVIAGGDTAGRIQQSLQIEALQVSKSVGIAAPLCYVYSKQPEFNGLEMAFKGGQIGSTDYLYQAQCARTVEFEEVALGSI
ncbi:MAG: four-carbon acid sugar kinase family protein [Desulfobacterales bacterium]|jgi:uncharacterized protein YgbK (DUF1537 family)